METEFKVNDKIRITKNGSCTYNFFTIGKEFFITDIKDYDKKIIILDDTYTINPNDSKYSCVYGDWELVQEKPRFYNAQVGDLVYCRLHGNGIIKRTTYSERYPLECFFEKYNSHREYNHDGRNDYCCEEPTLFYRKGEDKYLTERPEHDVDWSKVPEGTQVIPWDDKEPRIDDNENYREAFMAYLPHLEYPFWIFNSDTNHDSTGYKYCKLAEPCKSEWRK